MPRRPIIAVFGSKEHVNLARSLGSTIAGEHGVGIVLTGGTTSTGPAVKEAAIAGAEDAQGYWIGIGRGAAQGVPYRKPDAPPRSFVLETDLGHKRNYLEACLCDAAIALKGGEGTMSEVTFCLALGKPVVLIGDWNPIGNGLDNLVEEALKLVNEKKEKDGTPPTRDYPILDALLTLVAVQQGRKDLPTISYHPACDAVVTPAVNTIVAALKQARRKGGFPDLGYGYGDIKVEYDTWLREVRRTDAP